MFQTLQLLCQYEPDSVLKFLETFDSYRVEHCLRLCQEHGIVDAASFLLERVGDVGSALLLTLTSLNDNFAKLADALQTEHGRNAKNLEEVSKYGCKYIIIMFVFFFSLMFINSCMVIFNIVCDSFLDERNRKYIECLYWIMPTEHPSSES